MVLRGTELETGIEIEANPVALASRLKQREALKGRVLT